MSARANILAAVAGVVLLAAAPAVRAAEPHAPPALAGALLRNGEWLSKTELSLAPLSDRVALASQLQVGLGSVGIGLGAARLDVASGAPHAAHVGLELKALHSYGVAGLPAMTSVGPEVSLGTWRSHATVGWMFDVSDARNGHAQLGLGLGF
jgi:phage-related tail protein